MDEPDLGDRRAHRTQRLGLSRRRSYDEEARQYLFTTLWLGYCPQGYEIGIFDEANIRAEFADNMFRSGVAMRLWQVRMAELRQQGVAEIGPFNRIFERESERRTAERRTEAGRPPGGESLHTSGDNPEGS
ncbi:hypothetical protein Aab01nite_05020 [Paractinoplanes abujensis]|nr:hypothetical protein Aab01nite_05020 [Actinoplanes abujensis]